MLIVVFRAVFILLLFVAPILRYDADYTEEERLTILVKEYTEIGSRIEAKERIYQEKLDEERHLQNDTEFFINGKWQVEANFDHAAHWEQQKKIMSR